MFRGNLLVTRKRLNLTQQEVADYIGVSRVNYNRFERGSVKKMTYEDKVKLAEVLQITMDELNAIL